jgi:hypothetical protein
VRWLTGKDKVFAYGSAHGYLVLRGETDVRLSRFSVALAANDMTAAVAAEVMRNMIVFPLGRGPGRPGMEPELDVLMESAKTFAEVYESGGDLEGYPAWQRDEDQADAATARAARAAVAAGEPLVPWEQTLISDQDVPGDASDCPNC